MDYLDQFPKSLHIYFDYTMEKRGNSSNKIRFNASKDLNSLNGNYAMINIIRNSNQIQLGGYYEKYLKYKSKYVKI